LLIFDQSHGVRLTRASDAGAYNFAYQADSDFVVGKLPIAKRET